MHSLSEHNILLFLIQVFLLLAVAKFFGEICRRMKQPTLTAEILAGIVLGPTILGRFVPDFYTYLFPADPIQKAMLETLAWVGVLYLLLESGLEINLASVWRQRRDVLRISIAGVVVPLAIGFFCFMFLPDKYLVDSDQKMIFALFMATILAITAMPVVGRALHELNLIKTEVGFLIMSAHSVNDVIGWILFTLILTLLTTGVFLWTKAAFLLVIIICYIVFCLTIGRNFTNRALRSIQQQHLPEPSTTLSFLSLLGILSGILTQWMGIHCLFGFFIAGIMAGGAGAFTEVSRKIISQMVFAIFVPLFFVNIGLKVDFLNGFDLFLVLLLGTIGIGGKFLGGWIGTLGSKLSKADRLTVAVAHTPGGTIEIVVGFIAFESGLISQSMFVAIVFVAVLSSIILGPWLQYSLQKRRSVSILEYFSQDAIVVDVKAQEKLQALSEICWEASRRPGMAWIKEASKDLIERESAMGTAIEEGIAIPHARVAGLKKSCIILARSKEGIDWDSPDGQLTKLIFVIFNPLKSDDVHLKVLINIAKVMQNEVVRSSLVKAPGHKEMWHIVEDAFSA